MEYGTFKVREGVYIPDVGMDYPKDDPFRRLLKVEVEDSAKGKYQFDETYPYIDKSFSYKLNDILGFFVKWILVAFWNRFHFGIRIEGRKNVRKYRKELKNGAMCICNHVFVFDAFGVNQAVKLFGSLKIPMFAKHFNGKKSWFMRHVGGVPIPETRGGMKKFNEAFDEYHRRKCWFLIFPESVRWEMYVPIRPFMRGAFTMAYKYGLPIIPLVYSYRERKGLYRLFGDKNIPCVTLHVGEPVFFDMDQPRKEETGRMLKLVHERMVQMAGIEENPWPAEGE
ncbi:MAG: 1-acyl-sn-glycerol-3-phosphate acyltransferase [Bacteroidales bacterium]|nr:1-acyl-sn-glycerol-3-phosphate acyltransferase [Bacteroidales bacterium]